MKVSTEYFVRGKISSNKYLIHYINGSYLDTVLFSGVMMRNTCSSVAIILVTIRIIFFVLSFVVHFYFCVWRRRLGTDFESLSLENSLHS